MNMSQLQSNGLKLIMTLVMKSEGAPVQAPVIAKAENLKVGYVGKILFMLRKAGIVSASRGKNGGYTLSRDARDITLYDVLKALEVKEYESDICPNLKKGAGCSHSVDCALRPVMQSIDQFIHKTTSTITLHDLAMEERAMRSHLKELHS